MVNPGSFKGARLAFLVEQKPIYAEGVAKGLTAARLTDIQRRFFKRFPIDLDANEEPSSEALAAVDDDTADPEPLSPDEDKMTPEEYAKAMKSFKARSQLVTYRCSVSHVRYSLCFKQY